MVKICCISDTHCKHNEIIIPKADILLHAGDFSSTGLEWETKDFMHWFSKQPAKHKIFISGNHDFLDEENPELFKELLKEYPDITYLRDEGVEVEGIKIWGRPTTPWFHSWAFNVHRGTPKMKSTLSIIPKDTDILLTHGPAAGILDKCKHGERVGCEDLLNELDRIKPKYCIFGHIHEDHGRKEVNGIIHLNVSSLNERYQYTNLPVQFEIDIPKKKD